VDATKRSIDQAANKFDELGRRTRAIERNLSDVHELPSATSPTVPALELSEQSSGEGSETGRFQT